MEPTKPKQVIVMRKDLNMRKGKMVSQGAHSSTKVFFDRITKYSEDGLTRTLTLNNSEMAEWMDGSFTKITVAVNSEEELTELYEKAISLNLPCALIVDNGLTEFHGVKTKTCMAIGPDDSKLIDSVTGHLPLL